MKSHIIGLLVVLILNSVLVLGGCQRNQDHIQAANLHEIASPAGEGSGQPNLAVGPGGETYLSWMESDAAGSPLATFRQ